MIDVPIFYRDKPLFGFDLGHNSIKVLQIDTFKKKPQVVGYGYTTFEERAVKNGVIVDPELVAKEAYDLISKNLVGGISTNRVASSIPISRTFNLVMSLPPMDETDIIEAVKLEADQYIPVAVDELYIDYEITMNDPKKGLELLVVATPKNVIESYMTLFELLGLEVAVLETTISASTRLVKNAERTDVSTLLIDFGTISTDMSIFDTTLRVTGSVSGGGGDFTKLISEKLGVTKSQANTIKSKHGLAPGKKQAQIIEALSPVFEKMVIEIKRMVRFYQDRFGKSQKLEQIIIIGGGANMPGLADYLTDSIRIPTRKANQWKNLTFGTIQPPHMLEETLYETAAGLSLIDIEEIKT